MFFLIMLFIIHEHAVSTVIFHRSILCKTFDNFNTNSDYKVESLTNHFLETLGTFIAVPHKSWIMNILLCHWGLVTFLQCTNSKYKISMG